MTELKVDNITNLAGSGKPNLPVQPTVGNNAAISTLNTHEYTSSGTAPSNPKNGALWWDSDNNNVNVYIDGGFKKIQLNTSAITSYIDWGGDRGFFMGGFRGGGSIENEIDYFSISSTSNAQDFGDLTVARYQGTAVGSNTRVCTAGGLNAGLNVIDYITTATTGDATDFGDLGTGVYGLAGAGNGTRGLFFGGGGGGSSYNDFIQYITIATTGNTSDFGDISQDKRMGTAVANSTRAIHAGGLGSGTRFDEIEYVTIATTGNSTDFGDLHAKVEQLAGVSDATRGVFCGGINYDVSPAANEDTMEYITIATTGNAADFGNLTSVNYGVVGTSDGVTGIAAGGYNGTAYVNDIQKFTIQTLGNASVGMQLTTGGTGGKYAGMASSGNPA